MQELAGVNYNIGEQNKDVRKAEQTRDWKDTIAVLQYIYGNKVQSALTQASRPLPLAYMPTQRSKSLQDMQFEHGIGAREKTFKRKYQVVALRTTSSIKIDEEKVQVDPRLLFQRVTNVAQTSDELESAFMQLSTSPV